MMQCGKSIRFCDCFKLDGTGMPELIMLATRAHYETVLVPSSLLNNDKGFHAVVIAFKQVYRRRGIL